MCLIILHCIAYPRESAQACLCPQRDWHRGRSKRVAEEALKILGGLDIVVSHAGAAAKRPDKVNILPIMLGIIFFSIIMRKILRPVC